VYFSIELPAQIPLTKYLRFASFVLLRQNDIHVGDIRLNDFFAAPRTSIRAHVARALSGNRPVASRISLEDVCDFCR
jgi:hypothetical protein